MRKKEKRAKRTCKPYSRKGLEQNFNNQKYDRLPEVLKKFVKAIRTGNEVLVELEIFLGHTFLNAQSILQEVINSKTATSQADEKNLVTLMRQAKLNFEMQNDPQAERNLFTTNLLIKWAQLLMESS